MEYRKYFCPICENKIINYMNIRKDSQNKYLIMCHICYENYKYCKGCDLYYEKSRFVDIIFKGFKNKCRKCLSI